VTSEDPRERDVVSEPWTALPLDEIDGYGDEGRPFWHMVRAALGVRAFGINAWRATADGQEVIGEHDELGDATTGHEELYVVLSGHATFTIDGETVDAPTRTVVFVRDPAVTRRAVAREAGTTVLAVGAKAGAAFTLSPWERSAAALRYWRTGEWDKAIELLERELATSPESAIMLYNLACAEARGGRGDDAIEHLTAAIAHQQSYLESAQEDPDFAPIRDDPRFPRT
jgi:tetratricopeptide (TPR) repeat protein